MATAPDPVSCFPVPTLAEMPEDIRDRMLAVQEKAGFVPNVFLLLARRPEEFRAFVAYHDALMDKREGLTLAEREMIVVAISAANQCQYCVIAHGAILRIRAKNPLLADQVAINYMKADITPKQRAMLDFALKVLAPGGGFVAKVFQGGSEKGLLNQLKQRFATVRHMKPPASRKDSSELYVVATGFRPAAGVD